MQNFPSTLIIASSPKIAYQKALTLFSELGHKEQNNPDLFILDDYSISAVRTLKKFLSQKPFNHNSKIIFIPEIENLNSESQNALLKTLEEPGDNNYLILTSTNITQLLPTIISRCQKIKISSDTIKSDTKLWPITGIAKKDLDYAATITADKTEIKSLLQAQLTTYQQLLSESPTSNTSQIIKKLILSLDLINNNVDPKSALDYFFLK